MLRGNRWWVLLLALGVAAACDLNPQPEVPAGSGDAGQKSTGGTGGLLNAGGSAGMTSGSGNAGGTLAVDAATDTEPAFDNDADADGESDAEVDGGEQDADLDGDDDAAEID